MIHLSNARTKRRIAFAMLWVWLFAMSSAWANACLIENQQTHLHGSASAHAESVHAPLVSPAHLGADAEHPNNAGAAKSGCLKFCGDGAQTVVKLSSGVDLLDLVMAPPQAQIWTARFAAAVVDNVWRELPAPRPGLPLRTRFSRLTL